MKKGGNYHTHEIVEAKYNMGSWQEEPNLNAFEK
jgi:hypothetical protein